jgi:hypothetical protein
MVAAAPVAVRRAPAAALMSSDFLFFGSEDKDAFNGARLTISGLAWATVLAPPTAVLSERQAMQFWSFGDSFTVWSGGTEFGDTPKFATGGATYNLTTSVWTALPEKEAPAARTGAMSPWTGKCALVWGGIGAPGGGAMEPLADGAIYVP